MCSAVRLRGQKGGFPEEDCGRRRQGEAELHGQGGAVGGEEDVRGQVRGPGHRQALREESHRPLLLLLQVAVLSAAAFCV